MAVVTMVLFIALSCTVNVPEANIYVEAANSTNDDTPEDTGFAFAGGEWHQIDGTFDSASDGDEYRVDLSGSPSGFSDLKVLHNGKEVKDGLLLGINDFPLAVYTYDANDSIFVNYLAAAQDLFGSSLPYSSGTYSVQFQ